MENKKAHSLLVSLTTRKKLLNLEETFYLIRNIRRTLHQLIIIYSNSNEISLKEQNLKI